MSSFDIVSESDQHELQNAFNQTIKELEQRFDFRGTETKIVFLDKKFSITSTSEDRANAAFDVLLDKFIKRKISLKFLDKQKIFSTGNSIWKLEIEIKTGIDKENAKKIIEFIRQEKYNGVTSAIQGEAVRITSKSKDKLQTVMTFLKTKDFPLEISFNNFRN